MTATENGSNSLKDSPGFFRNFFFTDDELVEVKSVIRDKWEKRLLAAHPEHGELVQGLPMRDYHQLGERVAHAKLWNKDSRLFSHDEVRRITKMSLFTQLRDALGDFEVADIEGLGYPEIYWRLVRPGQVNDVAGVHADAWFYDYTNNLSKKEQSSLVKIWVAIETKPGESGLSVAPDSHLVKWKNSSEMRHGRPKPVFKDDLSKVNL